VQFFLWDFAETHFYSLLKRVESKTLTRKPRILYFTCNQFITEGILWKRLVWHYVLFYSQEVCHSLESLGSKSQCFDILQNGICKYLVRNSFHEAFVNHGWMRYHCLYLKTWSWMPLRVSDQVRSGAGQHGGRAAESSVQITGPVHPADWAHAALPVPVLPEPADSARHPGAGVADRNQPQKVCWSSPTSRCSVMKGPPVDVKSWPLV